MKQYISTKLLQTAEELRDRVIALRPFPEETLKSLREYYRIGLTYSSNALEGNSLTESETMLRLLNDGGVNGGVNGGENEKRGGVNLEELLFDAIRNNPGLNAPTLAEMLQKSLRTVQRYLKQLTENERIEFRGAPKNGGYHVIVK